MKAVTRLGGWAVSGAVLLLTGYPAARLAAQDTSAVDRGVRIGLTYRPGVRPGMVVLPGRGPVLDSVRAIVARDLDYSDRFELITLPGGDSLRASVVAPPSTPTTRGGGAAAAGGLNYPLYQALGADFAVTIAPTPGDSQVVTVHDVASGGVRREFRVRLPALTDPLSLMP